MLLALQIPLAVGGRLAHGQSLLTEHITIMSEISNTVCHRASMQVLTHAELLDTLLLAHGGLTGVHPSMHLGGS